MIDEKRVSDALQHLAEPDENGPAPVDGLLRRGRRARLHRTARTAGVAVAAVAATAGLAAVVRPGEPEPVPLALAAQTTQRTTFQFRQTFSLQFDVGDSPNQSERPYRGAYDPVRDRGYRIWVMPGEPQLTREERQIGDDCYIYNAPDDRWQRYRMSEGRAACWQVTATAEGSALGASASPGDLLAELEKAGQVEYAGRTGKGRHKVDTYRFTYRYGVEAGPAGQRTLEKRGTVDIDVATRRIIHLAVGSTDVTGDGSRLLTASEDLVLSRFGEPVVVKRPATIARR
ncbi:hypothetical protein [Jidongwangia harbinensis]|uniref:hypothetical protein n=1 Tax=Jidongwangia harbinensis TaxID=2878561 RepID=UPI001CD9FF16|nr:hypothetical protein [Jidongwangia harbinensis]MCA2217662.1 hypothetical protein [Jidongwangia harbinensis]